MTLKCPTCSKTQRYAPADAGLVIVCAACGQRMVVPGADVPGIEQPAGRSPWSFWSHPALWIVASAGICLALVIAGLFMVRPKDESWEALHRHEIVALRDQARQELAGRRVRQAYATFQRLEELVGSRPIADPELRAIVDRARTDRERVFDLILSELHDSMQTSATQPSVIVVVQAPATKPVEPVAVAASPPVVIAAASRPATQEARPFRPALPELVLRRQPAPVEPGAITDEEIGQSIQRGVDFLVPLFKDGKLKFEANRGNAYFSGLDALCVYALLQSGQAIKDERLNPRGQFVRELISVLKELPANAGPVTYARALRANALAFLNRKDDRAALKADVDWLIRSMNRGGYSYDDRMSKVSANVAVWDNSNSQYGLLGVWAGAEVNIEVDDIYWRKIENHWLECQLPSGEWAYGMGRGQGYLAMTVAGIASLLVTHDYLDAPRLGAKLPDLGKPPYSPALQKALDWLEANDNAVNLDRTQWGPGYTLYGIERVGLASGLKYLGTNDWYRILARRVVNMQNANGAWPRDRGRGAARVTDWDVVETAYMLLFLSRGRHPILMNKLRFGDSQDTGYWANRPRDAANLARFASRELERPLNWQVVNLLRPWHDWLDSPILYIASHRKPPLRDEDLAKIQQYAEAGGMIFAQADGGAAEFDTFARNLALRLGGELQEVPPDHELWSIVFKIDPKDRPPLKCLTNGSRILMLYSPQDISLKWQQRAETTHRPIFELGVNIFVYAAGKTDLRNRLASPFIAPPKRPPLTSLPLAKIRYGGNWNPEPYAHERLANYFFSQTSIGADWAVIDLADLSAKRTLVAHITGTAAQTFTDAQKKALKAYVEDGGVLLVDACGGNPQFAQSMRSALAEALPAARQAPLRSNHPLMTGAGQGLVDVSSLPKLRPFAQKHLGASGLRIEQYRAGHGMVIFSPADLTTGLLGTQTWGVAGYEPAFCQGLVRNVILWAAAGARE